MMYQYQSDKLFFGDIDLDEMSKNHPTPCYIYDLQSIAKRFLQMRDALGPETDIHFAVKSNPHPKILERLRELGAHVDVVSAGEMERSLSCGFSPEQVIFSGVAKTVSELRYAVGKSVGQLNVESFEELERISGVAAAAGEKARVALRLNPDVNPQTHPYITTGFRDNKFGISPSDLPRLADYIAKDSNLDFVGLSMHIGSQLLELDSFREAAEKILEYKQQLHKLGLQTQTLDLGGGLGIIYERQDFEAERELLDKYAQVVKDVAAESGCRLKVEPGRWLVGHYGALLTEVQYVKTTPYKKFAIVDTGMHHLLRPALYQAYHQVHTVRKKSGKVTYDIVGPICESSDVIGRDRELPEIESGDILVIADVGAYGACLASNYNLRGWPTEVVIG